MRLNLTLDDDQAAKLSRLADRAHLQPGTMARSLLLTALERTTEQDGEGRDVLEILDGVPGAYERMQLGRRQAAAGDTTPLDQV